MPFAKGDMLDMKKPHPCGSKRFQVVRSGVEMRIKCTGCGHEVFIDRRKLDKSVKSVAPKTGEEN